MRERTKYTGVYQRKHSTRRHLGRQDVCFDITYKNADGKKIWEKIGWTSEGITAQMASSVRAERVRDMRVPSAQNGYDKELTFASAFEIYARDHLPTTKRPDASMSVYKNVQPVFGDKLLHDITPHDIDRLIADMTAQGYATQTIKHAIALVRRVYRKVKFWGLYDGSIPTEKVTMPKVDAARTRYLTEAEAQALLDALKKKSQQWHDIAFLSLHTGMRLGEILQLEWQDVDFAGQSLIIRDAKAGSRTATLSKSAASILRKRVPQETGLVFPARGTGRASTEASESFKRCVNALGLNDGIADRRQRVVFHTLRHTFASWLAIKGVPLYVISQLLGHKSLAMTQRYAHLCPDAKRDAVAMLDDVLSHTSFSSTSRDKTE